MKTNSKKTNKTRVKKCFNPFPHRTLPKNGHFLNSCSEEKCKCSSFIIDSILGSKLGRSVLYTTVLRKKPFYAKYSLPWQQGGISK